MGISRRLLTVSAVSLLSLGLLAQTAGSPDLSAIHKLKSLETTDSHVMEIESWLTDVYGPRLTNSPDMREAAHWAEKEMTSWGIANVHEEPWTFGRGWSNDFTSVQEISPRVYPLIAYAAAWTPGTNGDVKAPAEIVSIAAPADFAKYRGQLRGKFVLDQPLPTIPIVEGTGSQITGEFLRYSDQELRGLETAQPARGRGGVGRGGRGPAAGVSPAQLMKFFLDEGVACVLAPGRGNSNDGTVFVAQGTGADSAGPGGRSTPLQSAEAPPTPCQLALANESYGRVYRTLEKKVPVTLDINVKNTYHTENGLDSFNITGEIPGGDLASQLVMLGGHFDSWQSGTGAADNAAGAATMMEALRLLKVSGLKMRRTVRIALWTGEEQGLLGSRAYALQHFRNAAGEVLPEQKQVSGYYNVDNGSGAIRGVYLQGNDMVAPLFERWMQPFHDYGMNTLTIRDTGGTDHLSFVADGIPGFQFIQDPLDYETRVHHSSADVYEHVIPWDMERNAAIVAAFVYQTANLPEMLPRPPLPPAPAPAGRGGR
ncbi:MAG TPA: M20/M25/M40 family metallo-hydrolase [Terriglobales bacterium]|nr:M20/M25/M40 family metallo-hydrolase [Terriglobales bacterium]